MVVEDFTTYTEVEPDDRIQKTSTHVDMAQFMDEEAYLYKDKGSNHFAGDFEHFIDVKIVSGQNYFKGWLWALANTVDDGFAIQGSLDYLALTYEQSPSLPYYRLRLWHGVGGSNYSSGYSGISLDTWYYLSIIRDENAGPAGRIYLYLYANPTDRADGTNDLSWVYINLNELEDFRYIFAGNTYNNGETYYSTMDMESLDLREEIFEIQSVTVNPTKIIRTGSEVSTLRCDWYDSGNLNTSDYQCTFWVRDTNDKTYGPYNGSITKESSYNYNGIYELNPDGTFLLSYYDVKAEVTKYG